jgi:hypothetical protein
MALLDKSMIHNIFFTWDRGTSPNPARTERYYGANATSRGRLWPGYSAVYCDTFAVDAWLPAGVVRLTFGEFTGQGYLPFFRSAVIPPIEDAKQLAKMMVDQIQEAEAEQKTIAATSKSGT